MTTQALLRCCHLTTAETYEPSINWCFFSSSCAWLTVCWWISFPTFVWIWKSGRSSMVGSNWKPKILLFSCQKLKEEAWVRFKINEMLFYGLDSWKIWKVIYYTIVKEGCITQLKSRVGIPVMMLQQESRFVLLLQSRMFLNTFF